MNRILSLQMMEAAGIEKVDGARGFESTCSYVGCNTISTNSEIQCSGEAQTFVIS
jgi:hypothetical protein